MATVTFAGATRTYSGLDHPAVDHLDLEITDGEFLVLVGPSGCGKSTTLRMLAGLEPVDEGTIHIGDRDVTAVAPKDRDIAMVFQSYALYPHMTVAENIGFHLKVKRVPRAERDQRVREAAAILDLGEYLDRKPAKLSGGQRQRVAMGRAIVRQPQVFLMDEPLSNLDAQLRAEMRSEIRGLQRQLGITMVYVTHDQIEAMSMADRVILLEAGRIVQNGTPVDLYESPANTFAARFIGTPPMNLMPLVAHDGGAAIAGTGGPVLLPAGCVGGMLGVRPEHIAIRVDLGLPATVEAVEYQGGDSLVACRVGVARIAVRIQGAVGFSRDDVVRVDWAPGAQHYFESSGRRGEVTAPDPVTMFT